LAWWATKNYVRVATTYEVDDVLSTCDCVSFRKKIVNVRIEESDLGKIESVVLSCVLVVLDGADNFKSSKLKSFAKAANARKQR
jgi:hypothetical protein